VKNIICDMIQENNNDFTKAEKIHLDTFREMAQTKTLDGEKSYTKRHQGGMFQSGSTFLHRNRSFIGSQKDYLGEKLSLPKFSDRSRAVEI